MRLQLYSSLEAAKQEERIDNLEAHWCDLSQGTRIVWTADGQPVRHIAPRSRLPVGRYNSRKAGRSLHHQSRGHGWVGGEKLALMICEINPAVVDFRSQHIRFDLTIDGKPRAYFPDIVALMHDGTIAVVEVKKDDRWQSDPDYRFKIDVVRAICADLGWRFEVWTQASMAPSARVRENIAQIQMQRFISIDALQGLLIEQAFAEAEGELRIGRISEVLGGIAGASDIARGLMCHGMLALPLDERLCDATVATKFTRCASPRLDHAA